MEKKGFTIIEMIIALAFFGVISMAFLPIMTRSIFNIRQAEKYSKDTFSTQSFVEDKISKVGENIKDSNLYKSEVDKLRDDNNLAELDINNVFGQNIKLHRLAIDIKEDEKSNSHGKINVFITETKPEIITPAVKEVKLTVEGSSDGVDKFKRIIDLSNNKLDLDKIKLRTNAIICERNDFDLYGEAVTEASRASYGISVVNWYISREKSSEANVPKTMKDLREDFILFREWNSGRAEFNYGQHPIMNIISPEGIGKDLKDYTDIVPPTEIWNEIKLNIVNNDGKTKLTEEEIDYIYGDRWIVSTVTPYQVSVARSGIEVPAMKNTTWPPSKSEEIVLNPIFIKGKTLNVESAKYLVDILSDGSMRLKDSNIACNKVIITFDREISQINDSFDTSLMKFDGINRSDIDSIYPSTADPNSIIITFNKDINPSMNRNSNRFDRGAILLKDGNEIDIRQNNSKDFIIKAGDLAYSFYKLDSSIHSKSKFEVSEEIDHMTGSIIYMPKYNPIKIESLASPTDEEGNINGIFINIEKEEELASGNKIITKFDIEGQSKIRWNIGLYNGEYYIIIPAVLTDDAYTTEKIDYAMSFGRKGAKYIVNIEDVDLTDKQHWELIYSGKDEYNRNASFTLKPRNMNIKQYISNPSIENDLQELSFSPYNQRDNSKWILKTEY